MGLSEISARMWLRVLLTANSARFMVQRRPSGYPRSRRTGHDPVRILILGAGIAIGYGVRTLEESLNGKLADVLVTELGRGIIVETSCAPALPLAQTMNHLGPNGAHTFRAVVFTPGLLELMRGETKQWRTQLQDLIAALRETGGADLRIVLCGLPAPREAGTTEAAFLGKVSGTNRVMASIAAELPLVSFAPIPDMTNIRGLRPFDEDYYTRCAAAIAEVLVPMLVPAQDDSSS